MDEVFARWEATHLGAVSESPAIRKLQVLTRISTDKRGNRPFGVLELDLSDLHDLPELGRVVRR